MIDPKDSRIWVDGCFDFAHHGHAGAMLQARQLGKELYVGVHSDEEILNNKGPPVMTMDERMTAVNACKWSTKAIENAPYVTEPEFIKSYGCQYVVHGDDITTDKDGNDCYQEVKDLGIFLVVKRTPNISTTDLVGRMLLMTKEHHYSNLDTKIGYENLIQKDNVSRFENYATDETGLNKGSLVSIYHNSNIEILVEPKSKLEKVVYVDGAFDLFHPGHINLLKEIKEKAEDEDAKVVVGIYDDFTINQYRGSNYPIMNVFERSLCVLQCKYVDGIIINAPREVNEKEKFLKSVKENIGTVVDVFPTEDFDSKYIINRVLENRDVYEQRQIKKGYKAKIEKDLKDKEDL
ncbi:unnamed protein product [Candida verbasci]|uniref:ethanolamine-phosphate cytidylyltransferase n=1 Tax=Candida verbasci TaxID=1227364 RepID=A0A9W4X963_9ASCO|nr:unnamed protein product [Candida verbasci]